ncbi:SDR family oxidoreductase [Mucilaginibacter terrae]|uniref:SDR family oxidoreductase n=1 Tax=Mucilaginibacter terrae TaxID=1955052 RepID=UPI00363444BF
MKILMTGATGEFASLVLPELINKQIIIRALVRSDEKAATAEERGAQEVVIGDLNDAESLKAAAKDVDGVFYLNPGFSPNEDRQGVAMVEAAVAAGVTKFVFSSVYHPSLSLVNHARKRPVEEALYDSGLNFVILQPSMFMQNLDAGWGKIAETGKFALPYSKQSKMSYIDYRDVAESIFMAFTTDKLDYGTFELSATGMLTREELAGMMSEALSRPVEAIEPAFDEWAQLVKIPVGPLYDGLKAMYNNYDRYGFHGGNSLVLNAVLGKEPRSMKDYLQELVSRQAL